MDAKISLTTRCNASCATCPVWQMPGVDMKLEDFRKLWDRMMMSSYVSKVFLNNTGDLYNHPDHIAMLKHVEDNKRKFTILTTNAGLLDYVPAIDLLIISFNGGTKESYERTTGLSWDDVRANIRAHYTAFSRVRAAEIHCLMWDGNAGTEKALLEEWKDFPGRIRLSYKYDNQMKEDHTLEGYKRSDRVPCDYLGMFSVMPDGRVVSCAHDFAAVTDFGNALKTSFEALVVHPARRAKMREHKAGRFSGLCEKCNYNTPLGNRIVYLK